MTGPIEWVTDPDPGGVPAAPGAPSTSVYDDLKAALSAPPAGPTEVSIVIPERPHIFMLYRTDIDYDEEYKKWVRRCTHRKTKDVNELSLAYAVLVETCVGVELERGGVLEEAFAPDGSRLTFRSKEFQALVGAKMGGAPEAIKVALVKDGHILQTMKAVMESAGFNLSDVDVEADGGPFER